MMKYMMMMFFIMVMLMWNNMLMFYYNLCFLFVYMMLFQFFKVDIMVNISGYLSLDYYSYMLIIMSVWIIGLMFMSLVDEKSKVMKMFMFMVMMLIIMVFFSVKNMILFYFFFELSLVPTFLLVIYWGVNPERLSASYYLLMYTMVISLPLLIYLLVMYNINGSLEMYMLMQYNEVKLSFWSMLIIMGAFYIKMPIYYFHIWLPKAHVEAPVYGSMVLAAILLKMGSYGLVRMIMIFLKYMIIYNNIMISIGIVGSLIASFICFMQIDMKSLVAYSSVVHMNLMLCSLMSLKKLGFVSAYIIMISHGLCSSGLFYMVNLYYKRSGSRLLLLNKGMINILPEFSMWWFLLCATNFSFPLCMAFIGEIYMIMVLIYMSVFLMYYLMLISFFSSVYSLYLFSYVQHGELVMMNKCSGGGVIEIMVLVYHYWPLLMILFNMMMF
uniref:NADH dehydrogenase subunit 4 n=1 Tax=Harpegnathos venator TaxID=610381 RepID=UPI002A7F08D2|nr:NADH dehydrogenase subunit 4 [Harpegnathos venator]WON66590.1 NADH dehydrogenase subunit 4 [Harpegnathos venator]